MKKKMKTVFTSMLAAVMVFSTTMTVINADNKDVYVLQYDEESSTYDKTTKTFDIHYDIPNDVKDYEGVKLDLGSAMIDGINQKLSMPGDSFSFNIIIKNESGIDLEYKKGSYTLTDPIMGGTPNKWGITAFDGELIDENFVPYRIASSEGIYSGLFETTSSSKVSGMMMATIDETLAKKGYTGNDALTKYLLKYYNESTKYNLDGKNAKIIAELDTKALFNIFSNGAGPNGSFSISEADYATLTEAQKSKITSYVDKVGKTQYRFRETEKELSEYYYNYFYDWCIGVVMGEHVTNSSANGSLENRTVTKSSVMKVYNNVNGVRDSQDEYIQNTLTSDNLKSGNSGILLAGYTLDGPLTGNNCQTYDFGFQSFIELEKAISFGDVTVNKTLDLNGFKNNDNPTFIFKLTDSKGIEHYKTVSFKEGETNQFIKFENIPLGKYVVEEIATIRYEQIGEIPKQGILTKEANSQSILIINKKEKNNDFSDTNVVVNSFKKTDTGIEISKNYQGTQE